MAGSTIAYFASFVIIVSVLAMGIIGTTKTLDTAFLYSVDQASSLKAKDTLLNMVENPGAPLDWAESGDLPTVFGLRWPSSSTSTPSPFGLMRLMKAVSTLSYQEDTYNDLSEPDIEPGLPRPSLYINKDICVEYPQIKGLVDPNNRYGFQINIEPVLKTAVTYEAPNLIITVTNPSGPVTGAEVIADIFTVSSPSNPLTIERSTVGGTTGVDGVSTISLTGKTEPFFVYIRINYEDLSSAAYYIRSDTNEPSIVPLLTDYSSLQVSLIHRKDLYAGYTYSGDLTFTSRFYIPLVGALSSSSAISGTVKLNEPHTLSLSNYKSTPGFLLLFYERTDAVQGVVVMPWGFNALGFAAKIGPEPGVAVNVVTQNRILNIGGVTYDVGIKLWREITSTEAAIKTVSVTVSSSPPGLAFVTVDGVPISTPRMFIWPEGSIHTVEAKLNCGDGKGSRYTFTGWSDGSPSAHSVVADVPKTLTASYSAEYRVTFEADPQDMGSVNPSTTNYYSAGSVIPITATNAVGYVFSSWTSSTGSITFAAQSASTDATINGSGTITANFEPPTYYSVTITSSPTGAGYITVDSNPITTPQPFTWLKNEQHVLAAVSTVNDGLPTRDVYAGWSIGGSQTQTYTVTSAATVTANFQTQHRLTVTSARDTPNPPVGAAYYNAGASVTASVTSPADEASGRRYVCTGWAGTGSVPLTGAAPTVTFTINTPSTITWNWKTQCLLTIKTQGITPIPDFNKQITVTVNGATTDDYGVTRIYDAQPNGWRKWIDEGTVANISVNDPGGSPNWSKWDDNFPNMARSGTMNAPLTLTAIYLP